MCVYIYIYIYGAPPHGSTLCACLAEALHTKTVDRCGEGHFVVGRTDAPHGVAVALDFLKAFDNLEPEVALHALRQWGLDGAAPPLFQQQQQQWRGQIR